MAEFEGIRKINVEFDRVYFDDVKLYEAQLQELIRDNHISYARNVRNAILGGMELQELVHILLEEIPIKSIDVPMMVEFVNLFLDESNLPMRLDTDCNVLVDGAVILASNGAETINEARDLKDEIDLATIKSLVDKVGAMLLNNFPIDVLLLLFRADVVTSYLNNALVAQHMNIYLFEHGSSIRFDRYLQPIEAPLV